MHRVIVTAGNRDAVLDWMASESHTTEHHLWTDAVRLYGQLVADYAKTATGCNIGGNSEATYCEAFFVFDRGSDIMVELIRA